MSRRGCTKEKNNVRSGCLCSKRCFLKEKMRNDHMSFCFGVHRWGEGGGAGEPGLVEVEGDVWRRETSVTRAA